MCVYLLSYFSRVQLFVTLWTVAHQASLSLGFSRQKYWSGLPCPPPGDLPNPEIEPSFLISPALAGEIFTNRATCNFAKQPSRICKLKKKKPHLFTLQLHTFM